MLACELVSDGIMVGKDSLRDALTVTSNFHGWVLCGGWGAWEACEAWGGMMNHTVWCDSYAYFSCVTFANKQTQRKEEICQNSTNAE